MFAASARFAASLPANEGEPDVSYFRVVELASGMQWYLVERESDSKGEELVLVAATADLLAMLDREGPSIQWIQAIQGGPARGKAVWQPCDVEKVLLARDSNGQHRLPVFEAADGGRFCDPCERLSARGLLDLKLAWRRPSAHE